MPASTCDPINTALRHALSSERASNGLEARLIVSAKSVLNSHIEFEQSDSYKSSVLDNLKSKYTVLSAEQSCSAAEESPKSEKNLLPEPKHTLFPLKSVKLGWGENGWHTGVGMYNTGNTCYLNSTLQALFHVPALINWLVSDREHRNNCENNCMVCAVAKTLLASQTQSQQPIRPWMVSSKLRVICRHLIPGRQEDAHEFLRYLVEAMERAYIQRFRIENLDARSKETTPLNQIFGGYLRSAVRCLQCNYVSTTVQHFQDLLLDIRKVNTLDEALTSYFACERLDDLEYKCESCHRKVSAVKQFSLERAPSVLCIQLKRFAGSAGEMMKGSGGKITKHIAFRQRLELTQFSHRKPATPLVYKLTSLVTHMGMSVNCGHYTAIGLTPSGTYYEFDDSSVRSVSPQIVLNTNAYIMFYELESESRHNQDVKETPRQTPATEVKTKVENGATFKNNMIPTQVRNKTLLNITKAVEATKVVNGGSSMPTLTPEPKVNGVEKTENGVNGDSKKNGDGHRSLVPYESDGGSTSESEDAPSGKWLVSARTEVPRTPSLNGDTGWRNKTKVSTKEISTETNTNRNENGNGTVSQLMRMSHSGYGSSVVSWDGTRSNIDKEFASERRETLKRHRNDTDEMDRGRRKKQRHSNNIPRSNPGYNAFQEYQQSQNRPWQNGFRPKHYYNVNNQRFRRRFFSNNAKRNRFH